MAKPQLYTSYTKEQISFLLGSTAEGRSLCNGQWLVFPENVVCLASIGEGPGRSHFADGAHFHWVADRPCHVSSGQWSYFLPAQALGGTNGQHPIHLFVSLPEQPGYLYVGELAPSCTQEAPGGRHHGVARFQLRRTLPSRVWLQLGGLRLGNTDHASVDRALDRLRGPTTVQDRLRILQEVVEYWHGPIAPEDGMSDTELAGLCLPLPLRWWYGWAGKRWEITSGQNFLFSPRHEHHQYRQLAIEDGYLRFYSEKPLSSGRACSANLLQACPCRPPGRRAWNGPRSSSARSGRWPLINTAPSLICRRASARR